MASTPITFNGQTLNIDPVTGAYIPPPDSTNIQAVSDSNGGLTVDPQSIPLFGHLNNVTNMLDQAQLKNLNTWWSQLQVFVESNPALVALGGLFLILMAHSSSSQGGRRR